MDLASLRPSKRPDRAGGRPRSTRHLGGAGNGDGPGGPDWYRAGDGFETRPTRPPGPSTRYALIALGLAALIFVVGLIADGLSPSTAPRPTSSTVRTAPGSPLPARSATSALRPITVDGQPPSDILGALSLPAGTAATPGSVRDDGVGDYDETMGFDVAAPQQKVITFFRDQLRSAGWSQITSGRPSKASLAPAGSVEVLGRHASEDGNYWEAGVVVAPTSFPSSAPAGTTSFTLRLYVVEPEQ